MLFAVRPAPGRGGGLSACRAISRYFLQVYIALFLAVALLHSVAADSSAASFVSEAPAGPVEDDLYFVGPTLEISHPVTGDVLALAQRVYINAPVTGTVLAVAQEVIIGPAGAVHGTVRAVGQSVRVNGRVTGDLLAAGNDLWISKEGAVERDVLLAGNTLEIGGIVGRGLRAAGDSVTISGQVAGPARVDAARLEVGATARMDQGLTYSSEDEPIIAPGARISGSVERVARPNGGAPAERSVGSVVVGRLKSMVAPLLLGLLLILLFPAASAAVAEVALRRLLPSFGLGILALIVIPLLLLMLLLTTIVIGGLMAPAVLAAAFAFVLSLGNVVVGMAVGGGLLRLLRVGGPSNPRLRMAVELVLGVLILTAISVIPVVNVAVSVVTLAVTLGSVILAYIERRSLLQWGPRTPAEEAAI